MKISTAWARVRRAHVLLGHLPVARQVEPEPAQRVDGDTEIRGPARIGGVVHETALAGDDFLGKLLDR